jgi:hypothetical protein
MKRIVSVVLVVAASASFAAAAEAGRNRDATLAVSPASALLSSDLSQWEPAVGDNLVFSGCGYEPNKGVSVRVDSPYAYSFSGAIAGADGCFATKNTYTALEAGDYEAHAWQSSSRRADASLKFTVSP